MSVGRPLFLQNIANYTADEFRTLLDAVSAQPGIIRNGCGVTVNSPAGMSVLVQPGYVIVGALSAISGKYLMEVTAPDQVLIPASSPYARVDQIVAEVLDTAFADPSDQGHLICVPGLSTGPAALAANQTPLARIAVASSQVIVTAGNITDVRRPANPAPLGYVAQTIGPATNIDALPADGAKTVLTVTAPVTINRRYRVSAYHQGIQITSPVSTSRAAVYDDQGGSRWIWYATTSAINESIMGTTVMQTVATTTRTATWTIKAQSTAGAIRTAGGSNCCILIEDIGIN